MRVSDDNLGVMFGYYSLKMTWQGDSNKQFSIKTYVVGTYDHLSEAILMWWGDSNVYPQRMFLWRFHDPISNSSWPYACVMDR